MFQTLHALAFAVALFQQPPPDLDPSLRAAIDDFRSTTGCRFEADVAGVKSVAAVLLGGETTSALDWLGATRIRGGFERGKPLFVAAGSLLAFRAGEALVFKERGGSEWSARGPLAAVSTWILTLLGHVPGPGEVVDEVAARIASCKRVTEHDDETTFECQLAPAAAGRVASPNGSSGSPVALAACTVRLTVRDGQLVLIELPEGDPATRPTSRTSLVRRYRLMDIGRTEVAVPEEAARLLGSR